MVARLAIAGALVLGAVAIAVLLEVRRRPAAAAAARRGELHHLDRQDFPRPDATWLVVLFTSRDCEGCGPMAERLVPLESRAVAVTICEYHADRALHERYAIDGVPYLVVADEQGLVRASLLGGAAADELWRTVHAVTSAR